MSIKTFCSCVTVAAWFCGSVPGRAEDKTAGEKTSEVWEKTKTKTKDISHQVAETTRHVADDVENAIAKPDADARKVEVTITDTGAQVARTLKAGKTAFVVTNRGKERHNFEIEGNSLEKRFWLGIAANDTKTLQVDLKPGTYEADCGIKEHTGREQKVKLTVK
ncbi:MAG: cupredoxin domain-containing protein [Chthoniobacterales bacterium]|nr:cupredoxin domain-containing protein [Chthoniobacterales bacterium]